MNVLLVAFVVFLVALSNGQILQDMNVTVQPTGDNCNINVIENTVYSFNGTSNSVCIPFRIPFNVFFVTLKVKRSIFHSSSEGLIPNTISISVVENDAYNATLDSSTHSLLSSEFVFQYFFYLRITWLVTPTPEADQVIHFELSYEAKNFVKTVFSRSNNGPAGRDINARNTHGVVWDATGNKKPTSLQYVFLFKTNLTSSDQSDVQTDQLAPTTSPTINSQSVTWTVVSPWTVFSRFTVLFPWTNGPSNCIAYPEKSSSSGSSNDDSDLDNLLGLWIFLGIFGFFICCCIPIVIVLLCVCGVIGGTAAVASAI